MIWSIGGEALIKLSQSGSIDLFDKKSNDSNDIITTSPCASPLEQVFRASNMQKYQDSTIIVIAIQDDRNHTKLRLSKLRSNTEFGGGENGLGQWTKIDSM